MYRYLLIRIFFKLAYQRGDCQFPTSGFATEKFVDYWIFTMLMSVKYRECCLWIANVTV